MAKRGDVLVARQRLGFGRDRARERFVALQADALDGLDTVLVAPLDEDSSLYQDDPLVVHVSAREAGADRPHVVLVHLLRAAQLDRFEAAVGGRLSRAAMGEIEALLRVALAL